MVEENFREKLYNHCIKFLGYFGVLIFGRISFKFIRGMRRMFTKKIIPLNRNGSNNLNSICNYQEDNFSDQNNVNVILNGLNSSVCEVSIFILQTRNVIQEFIRMGYRIILICDRRIKKEVTLMISEINLKLGLNINDKIILKTCRLFQDSEHLLIELYQEYFKKKLKIYGRNHIIFNNCTVSSCSSLNLINNYILMSTILIKNLAEYMIRNKGEFIIIGLFDKIISKKNSNIPCSNSQIAYNYFKNLHYLLRKEYHCKIHITFIKNYQDSYQFGDIGIIQTNPPEIKFFLLNFHKINLNRRKNIQFNSYFWLFIYCIKNFLIKL